MKYLSICIPTYEMGGLGPSFLRYSFDILHRQTFTDFQVVVSDHSFDNGVQEVCTQYANLFEICYIRNPLSIGSSSANINNAIRHATGSLIKILFQDDFLLNENSLAIVVNNFDIANDQWLATGSEHSRDGKLFERPYHPTFTQDPHLGNNLIGSPSVLTIKNDHPLLFDEKLIWLMDGDYYKRCADAFGPPKLINDITVVNRIGTHQITSTLATKALRQDELAYIMSKFGITTLPTEKKKNLISKLFHRS